MAEIRVEYLSSGIVFNNVDNRFQVYLYIGSIVCLLLRLRMNENMCRLAIIARQDHATSAGAASLVIGAAMEIICKTGSVSCTRLKLRYSET